MIIMVTRVPYEMSGACNGNDDNGSITRVP